jgi:soluble lytic murein transglycosylase
MAHLGRHKFRHFIALSLVTTLTGIAPLIAAEPLGITPQAVTIATTTSERNTFLAAEKALKSGQLTRYRQLKTQLNDYPLLPYLEYEYLRKRLQQLPSSQIEAFLQQYKNTPLEQRLHSAWLSSLAKQGRWEQYLHAYQPGGNTREQCLKRWALYNTGHQEQAFEGIEKLWLVDHSQPRSCDQIFKAWQTAGHIDADLAWQRFYLAMQARKTQLAHYLINLMPADQQHWANLWLRIHRQPHLVTNEQLFAHYHPMRNQILMHGIQRMAYRNLDQAVMNWDIIRHRYPFNETQRSGIERSLAMRHAFKGHPEALGWLASLSEPDLNDPLVGDWRIRTALDQQNWDAVLNGIHLLDEQEQNSLRWSYWRARSLEALDQQSQAYDQYWALAQSRSYYGFLAADRLGVTYRFDNQPVLINADEIEHLEQLPGLERARELFALNRILDARREWLYTTRSLPESLLQQAATIAHQWGWHDRAILTMARTHYRDDLALRFPLAYRDQVSQEASKQHIDPALAFALIRQESAFTADVRSHAGATGLMQLMPRTARQAARKIGMKFSNRIALTDAGTNIKLGMSHLRQVMNRYQNNPVLATAAYNAGEHRVKQWLPKEGIVPADIWTETMPFTETRNYVQNILLFATIYQQRLGQPMTTLEQRMPPISSPGALLADRRASLSHDPS